MSRLERLLRRLAGEEAGFTLIELLVAATLVAGGLAAVLTVFDGSRDLVSHAERNEAATHQAEQEVERILAMDYDDVGHGSQTPVASAVVDHPDSWVRSSNRYQYDHRAGGAVESLVTGTGTLTRWRAWSDGRLGGRVYRYVTAVYDPQLVQNPDVPDAKRVTVAVTVEGGATRLKPVVLSSIVFDRDPES